MEFNTLTRRVAEFSGIEAAEIEASQPSTRSPRDRRVRCRNDLSPWPRPQSTGARPAALRRRDSAEETACRQRARPPTIEITPQALEAERTEAARKAKFDRSRYEIVQKRDRLEALVARAREIGVVAINAETVGEDPMQAAICGIALAVAPNEACYVPLAHRKAGNGDGGLFGGERAARPAERRRRAWRRSSRCSKTRACSRSGRT